MSFLTLNDWQVDIIKGGARSPTIIGDEGRSFSGGLLRDRRVIKDRWQFETKELQASDASALVGMLLGLGDRWDFDVSTMYSDKGIGPGSTAASFRWGESADGVAAAIQSSADPAVLESKFGAGALAVDPATDNLLPEATRRATATAGFGLFVGGALATNTTYYVPTPEAVGTSVKHTRAALTQGLTTNNVACAAATDYSGCVYIMTLDAGVTVRVQLNDLLSDLDDQSFVLTAGVWRRCEVAGTSDGAAANIRFIVTVTAGAAAGDIYTDAWQIEQQTHPTTWADGVRAASDLEYSGGFLDGSRGVTIAAWARMPAASRAAHRYLCHINEYESEFGSSDQMVLYRPDAGDGLSAQLIHPVTGITNLSYATAIWDNDWHHVALVYGKNGRTGVTFLKLYVDGSEVDEETSINYPEFGADTLIYPGNHSGGTVPFDAQGLVDELLVLPYAAAADQIAAWAAMTAAPPTFPALLAKGDAIETPHGVLVEGAVPSRDYSGVVLGGDYHSTAQRVKFELEQR